MIAWSIAAMVAAEPVGAIVIACPPGEKFGLDDLGVDPDGLGDVELRLVEGGEERSESVRNAIVGVETELVAIHDAARPLLVPDLAEGAIATLIGDPGAAGAIAATPVTDTIKQVNGRRDDRALATADTTAGAFPRDRDGNTPLEVLSTQDRSRLWAAQTPQVFRLSALREALGASGALPGATDEAMLVEAAGGRVLIHPSPPANLKVTTPLDLELAGLLLAERAPR